MLAGRMRIMLPFFLLLAGCAGIAPVGNDIVPVVAKAVPLDPSAPGRQTLGKLRYLGGIHLRSADARFGGISALRWDSGALAGVTDKGDFIRFAPVEEGERLTGVRDVRIADLRDRSGSPLTKAFEWDAEALELSGGRATVSFEHHHRIWSYSLRNGMPAGVAEPLYIRAEDAAWIAGAPENGGVEAIAHGPFLSIAIAEEKRTADGGFEAMIHHNGMKSDAPAHHRQRAGLKFAPGYAPTDAVLDGSRLLVLTRRYVEGEPLAARLYAVALAPTGDSRRIAVGAPALIADFTPALTVDNMEGLAIRHEAGRRFLYIVSDDNFGEYDEPGKPEAWQRTLLMKFELLG
jgi:hypothetical protein